MNCLGVAAAKAFNVSEDKFCELIGRTGDEIRFPELKPPYCYDAFHIQEIIDVGLKLGYAMTEIQRAPVGLVADRQVSAKLDPLRLENYLSRFNGIIGGTSVNGIPHAAYWNYRKPDRCFFSSIHVFWIVTTI